jgi:glycosyltransferase involved in cell wall biosynthesis
VVASDLPPLREIVNPGHTGSIARAGDPDSLAAAIEPLISDSAMRAVMGATARSWVARHRTWLTVARTYRRLYEALTGAEGRDSSQR